MHKAIAEVDCVKECGGPEGGRETGAILESTSLDGEFVVHELGGPVLGRAVSACAFDSTVKSGNEVAEFRTFGKFAALVRSDKSCADAEFGHERTEDGNGWFLSAREEHPDST